MAEDVRDRRRGPVVERLLEEDRPPVRYDTPVEVLGRSEVDPDGGEPTGDPELDFRF